MEKRNLKWSVLLVIFLQGCDNESAKPQEIENKQIALYSSVQIDPTTLPPPIEPQADPNEIEKIYKLGFAQLLGNDEQTKNIEQGLANLQICAKNGHPQAQYTLASLFFDGQEVLASRNDALKYLRNAANANIPAAQVKLAKILLEYAVPEYDRAAFHWLMKARSLNHPEGSYLLATFYLDGIGTLVDYDKAFALLSELAVNDYYPAQLKLGQMLYNGLGCEKNTAMGIKWILNAIHHGAGGAQEVVQALFQDRINEMDEMEEEDSKEWVNTAAQMGNPQALFIKGTYHLYGKKGFQQNIELGLDLIEKSANKKYALAARELGIIHERGLFGKDDSQKALQWYRQAALCGDDFSTQKLNEGP